MKKEFELIVGENLLLVDKEAGWTSNDVVRLLKKKLNPFGVDENGKVIKKVLKQDEKRFRIGHAGTLDPFATGLLLIMLNDATKQFNFLQTLPKEYITEIEFGQKTDTQDVTGEVVWEYNEAQLGVINLKKISRDKLDLAVQKFTGIICQTPPAYSAVKINGKRLHDLARKSKSKDKQEKLENILENKKRQVTVYEAEILKVGEKDLTVRFVVSSGTYIRTLAQDIGETLGYGAFAKSLRRSKIGGYNVEDAKKLNEISKKYFGQE